MRTAKATTTPTTITIATQTTCHASCQYKAKVEGGQIDLGANAHHHLLHAAHGPTQMHITTCCMRRMGPPNYKYVLINWGLGMPRRQYTLSEV